MHDISIYHAPKEGTFFATLLSTVRQLPRVSTMMENITSISTAREDIRSFPLAIAMNILALPFEEQRD